MISLKISFWINYPYSAFYYINFEIDARFFIFSILYGSISFSSLSLTIAPCDIRTSVISLKLY